MDVINFRDANSRDTYFTIHNVKAAHRYSKGKGIRVGIIDWLFAADANRGLYADTIDITGFSPALNEYDGHGLWMATVLREIAPECKIVAINGVQYYEHMSHEEQEENRCRHLVEAIERAIISGIDVLTYSHAKVPVSWRKYVGDAIRRAVAKGIATTFIHNGHPDNLWPYACMPYDKREGDNRDFTREPDVNIYHHDYNTIMVDRYQRYLDMVARNEPIRSGDDLPFFSCSSTSPVLGGFIAILKSLRPELSPAQCKEILIDTSYAITETGEHWYDLNPCPKVVDIGKACGVLAGSIA